MFKFFDPINNYLTTFIEKKPLINQKFLMSITVQKESKYFENICQTRITIKHILQECPTYELVRTSLNFPHNIKNILDEGQTLNIIKFITICNLINKF